MRRQLVVFPFLGLIALFFVSCASGNTAPRQEPDTPRYGSYPNSRSDVRYQQYGPQDRAGNPTQSGVPPYSGCQYSTRC
jgi:hypothetical protein